eukprot:g7338.t1
MSLSLPVAREALQTFFNALDTDIDGFVSAEDVVQHCVTTGDCNTVSDAVLREMWADAKRRRWVNGGNPHHITIKDLALALDPHRGPYRKQWLHLIRTVVPSASLFEGRGLAAPTVGVPMSGKEQFAASMTARSRRARARARSRKWAATGRPATSPASMSALGAGFGASYLAMSRSVSGRAASPSSLSAPALSPRHHDEARINTSMRLDASSNDWGESDEDWEAAPHWAQAGEAGEAGQAERTGQAGWSRGLDLGLLQTRASPLTPEPSMLSPRCGFATARSYRALDESLRDNDAWAERSRAAELAAERRRPLSPGVHESRLHLSRTGIRLGSPAAADTKGSAGGDAGADAGAATDVGECSQRTSPTAARGSSPTRFVPAAAFTHQIPRRELAHAGQGTRPQQLGGIRPDEQFVRLAREDKGKALDEAAAGFVPQREGWSQPMGYHKVTTRQEQKSVWARKQHNMFDAPVYSTGRLAPTPFEHVPAERMSPGADFQRAFGSAWRANDWTRSVEPQKMTGIGGIRPDEQFVRLAREDKGKALDEAAAGFVPQREGWSQPMGYHKVTTRQEQKSVWARKQHNMFGRWDAKEAAGGPPAPFR